MTNEQKQRTEQQHIKYDTQDDYYITVINNIELNIRAYNNQCISLWIYDHNKNTEIIDDELSSLEEIKQVLKAKLQLDIELPTLKQLLRLQELKGGI